MTPSFSRLVWKEYRAQRALWLTLAGCLVGLQLTLLCIGILDRHAAMTPMLMGTAAILTCCFAVASPALLFAGEEDLVTAGWLRQLPVSTGRLFWSKVWASAIGLAAMSAVGSVIVVMTALITDEKLQISTETARNIPFFGCTLFVISLFWSLRCKRVFYVIGLTAVTFIGLVVLWHRELKFLPFWVDLIPAMIFAVAVLTQPNRWHKGFRAGGTNVASVTQRIVSAVRPRWIPSWSERLHTAASTPTQLGRLCSVLAWRELRHAVPFAIGCISFSIIATLLRVYFIRDISWTVILLHLVIVECGLRTFRHDQLQLNGMFWSHRGASPLLVVGIRNLVWVSTLVMTTTAMLLIDLPHHAGYLDTHEDLRLIGLLDRIRVPQLFQHYVERPPASSDDCLLQLHFAITWALGGFFLCQLFSCWIRRPLIALFLGLSGFSVYTVLLMYSIHWDIPLVLSVWPVMLICVAGIIKSRRHWMDRRMSVRIGFRRLAFITIALLCLWPVQIAWRLLQIPQTTIAAPVPQALGYSRENQFSEWGGHWRQLSTALQPAYVGNGIYRSNDTLDDDRIRIAMEHADAILKFDIDHELASSPLPPSLRHPWSQYPAQPVTFAFLQAAAELHQDGKPANALDRLSDAVRILRYLQREATSWDQWQWSKLYEKHVLQQIHLISADDALSGEQLTSAAIRLRDLFEQPVLANHLHTNRLTVYTQLLFRGGYLSELYENERLPRVPVTNLMDFSYPERWRLLQLMNLASTNPMAYDVNNASRAEFLSDVSRWAATTPMVQLTDLPKDPHFSGLHYDGSSIFDHLLWETVNAERATVLILRLQAWRRDHGSFPESLDTLRPTHEDRQDLVRIESEQLTDIQTGLPFSWADDGLHQPYLTNGDSNSQRWIDQRQPVIRAKGARSVAPFNSPATGEQSKRKSLPLNPNRIVYLDGTLTPVVGP